MRFFYLDASALGKRYVPELGTALVSHLFANAAPDRLLVFNVGVAEAVSILVRRRNGGRISAAVFAQAVTDLGTEVVNEPRLRKIPAENALVTSALPFIDTHALNGTDAIVLRSALDFADQLRASGDDLVVVASDRRLLRAAQAEGLLTFDPETQTQAELDALLAP